MGFRAMSLAAAAAIAVCAGSAHAEGKQGPKVESAKRRTVLHFGEDDIRGDLTRPDGELVQAPRKMAQPSLVRVRRSFVDRALAAPARGQ